MAASISQLTPVIPHSHAAAGIDEGDQPGAALHGRMHAQHHQQRARQQPAGGNEPEPCNLRAQKRRHAE
jgi:hypothetical protein